MTTTTRPLIRYTYVLSIETDEGRKITDIGTVDVFEGDSRHALYKEIIGVRITEALGITSFVVLHFSFERDAL
ncbi:hypothetical protein AB0I81_34960 [Nonomuraea sp. NPDC050404]|uniref:hypothetical protein n=1 Tax=Nonomuraea sp. NPDC050404 TaxID=3155783 RepID=UPI0033DD5D3E